MLGKMLVHGLAAAIVIGSAAAVYAQAKDNGYLPAPAAQARFDGKPAGEHLVKDVRDDRERKDRHKDKRDRRDHDRDRRDRDHD